MAVLHLDIQEEQHIRLITVCCSLPEYRLVWAMNALLGIKMVRQADFEHRSFEHHSDTPSLFSSAEPSYFSTYLYEGEMERVTLVSNQAKGIALVEGKQRPNYLVQFESLQMEEEEFLEKIESIEGVTSLSSFDCSMDNLAATPFNDMT